MTAQEHVARVVAQLTEWRTVREIAVRTDLRIQTVRWAIQQHARTSVLVCRRRANQAREYRICPEAVGVEVIEREDFGANCGRRATPRPPVPRPPTEVIR